MYYQPDTRFETDYEKTIRLDEGEYITVPFCRVGTIVYQVSSDDQYNGLYVCVIPRTIDPAKIVSSGGGQYYPDCSAENLMVSYSDIRNVAIGDKLFIYNLDYPSNGNPILVDVKIIDANEMKLPALTWDLKVFEYDYYWLNEIWNMYH